MKSLNVPIFPFILIKGGLNQSTNIKSKTFPPSKLGANKNNEAKKTFRSWSCFKNKAVLLDELSRAK